MSELQEYEVQVEGQIMHRHYKAGERIWLHPDQAKYYLMDGRLKPVDAGKGKGGKDKAA